MKRFTLLWIWGALALVMCEVGTFAQEGFKPGPEHAVLKEFEGTWDAVVKFGDGQTQQISKGVAQYKLECGGMWLVSEFNGEFGGAKFQGRGIDGYDLDKRKYVSVWVDSMATTPTIAEGNYDPSSKSLVFSATGKGADGKPAKIRSVTSLKHKDRRDYQMFSTGEDGKEQLMMTIEYTRRK